VKKTLVYFKACSSSFSTTLTLLWLQLSPTFQNPRTTDTQWRHKSKISERLGRCGRQNMLRPYLKIWDWDWIFGRGVKAIFSLGVRSPCQNPTIQIESWHMAAQLEDDRRILKDGDKTLQWDLWTQLSLWFSFNFPCIKVSTRHFMNGNF